MRSPARAWHDRHNVDPQTGEPMGIDCDCMTLFICSVLYNLEIKNVYFRIAKYEEAYWEHIYPIIKLPNGKQITIDCVLHKFNQEAKYTAKQDTAMDLEYLNGVSDSTDFMGIMDEHEALATLGKIFKKKAASGGGGGAAPKRKVFLKRKKRVRQRKRCSKRKPQNKKRKKSKSKKFVGKGLHVTNRINPVTVALRNGVLAGMKLNFLKIAEALRWSYLSPEQAQAKGADMSKYQKLKGVREKLEKIFFGAGGKPENLKKAILTGRGNKDKAVPMNGLGYVSYQNIDGLHEEMPLNELLGREIYYSENVEGLEGLNGFEGLEGFGMDGDLGAATAASVAAASTVLTTIAALIKSIGSIFPGKAAAKGGASKKKAGKQKKQPSVVVGADQVPQMKHTVENHRKVQNQKAALKVEAIRTAVVAKNKILQAKVRAVMNPVVVKLKVGHQENPLEEMKKVLMKKEQQTETMKVAHPLEKAHLHPV